MASPIFDAALALAEQGASLVLLRQRSKAPVETDWAAGPFLTPADLKKRWRSHNIGVRLGEPSKIGRLYLHAFDLDVRDPKRADEAWDALLELFPGADRCAAVISGSGGESRHLYFLTDKPFRKRNIAKSPDKVKTRSGEMKRAWEIDLYGTGAQVVLPPSIHPDSGREYEWADGTAPNFKALHVIKSADIERVMADRPSSAARRREREPFDIDDLETALFKVPHFDNRGAGLDYDDWLAVVFAVHEHYAGSDEEDDAYAILEEWSAECDKFEPENLRRIYEAVHDEEARESRITIASIVKRLRDYEASPEGRRRRWKREGIGFKDESETVRREERKLDRARKLLDAGVNPDEDDSRDDDSDEDDDERTSHWRTHIDTSPKTGAHPTLSNIMLFLRHDDRLKKHLRRDVFSDRIVWYFPDHRVPLELKGVAPQRGEIFREFVDTDYIHLRVMMRSEPMKMQKDPAKWVVLDAVDVVTKSDDRKVDIVRENLFREEWDGVPRIERFFIDYLGAEDTPANRECARFFFCSATVRALSPGAQVDNMVVLQGEQGGGKDRVFRVLLDHVGGSADPAFSQFSMLGESKLDMLNPRDFIPQTRGKVVVHLSELASLRGRAADQVKHFITLRSDEGRLAYGRTAASIPRSWVLLGSTNEELFLNDATGNRRFLVVRCIKPPLGNDGVPKFTKRFSDLTKERGQHWAEAKHIVDAEAKRRGHEVRSWAVDPKVWAEIEEAQRGAEIVSSASLLAERIAEVLDLPADLEDVAVRKFDERDRKLRVICNQATYREVADMIGMSDEEFRGRNGGVNIAEAFRHPALSKWERVGKAVWHKGVMARVCRRRGTDGDPTLINHDDDESPEAPPEKKVVRFEDERDKRRSIF